MQQINSRFGRFVQGRAGALCKMTAFTPREGKAENQPADFLLDRNTFLV